MLCEQKTTNSHNEDSEKPSRAHFHTLNLIMASAYTSFELIYSS